MLLAPGKVLSVVGSWGLVVVGGLGLVGGELDVVVVGLGGEMFGW